MIENRDQLVGNGRDGLTRGLRSDACDILEAALAAVDPEQAVMNALRLDGDRLVFDGGFFELNKINRVIVIGGGKAGGLMAKAVESLLGERVSGGLVNVLEGTEKSVALKRIVLNGASHPVPSQTGVEGVAGMLGLTEGLGEDDLVITLISGGGSALMPYPAEDVSLSDLQHITGELLRAGATINELNAVRKHLSSFKGGQLARHCMPARVLSLILSDVVNDPLDTIASGPTAPDSYSFSDAKNVLEKYGLYNDAPETIKTRLSNGIQGKLPDTPKKDDPVFSRVQNLLIANNAIAAKAAKDRAHQLGYESIVVSTSIEGEARVVGADLSMKMKAVLSQGVSEPAAFIIGGETTVTVRGSGLGGRNQELALGAAVNLAGCSCLLASLGTDGIDGPTRAAGAFVDGYTVTRAVESDLDPSKFLDNNDSYHFFEKLGDLIITGPTGTNVNDLLLVLVR